MPTVLSFTYGPQPMYFGNSGFGAVWINWTLDVSASIQIVQDYDQIYSRIIASATASSGQTPAYNVLPGSSFALVYNGTALAVLTVSNTAQISASLTASNIAGSNAAAPTSLTWHVTGLPPGSRLYLFTTCPYFSDDAQSPNAYAQGSPIVSDQAPQTAPAGNTFYVAEVDYSVLTWNTTGMRDNQTSYVWTVPGGKVILVWAPSPSTIGQYPTGTAIGNGWGPYVGNSDSYTVAEAYIPTPAGQTLTAFLDASPLIVTLPPGSTAGQTTLTWGSPVATSMEVFYSPLGSFAGDNRQLLIATSGIVPEGALVGSSGAVTINDFFANNASFFLYDNSLSNIDLTPVAMITLTVKANGILFTASPNPVNANSSGLGDNVIFNWVTPGFSPTLLRFADAGGTILATGTDQGTVNLSSIPDHALFLITDASTGQVLGSIKIHVLIATTPPTYPAIPSITGSRTLFGITLPDETPMGVFPFDPDVKIEKEITWLTKVLQFAPNLLRQSYLFEDVPNTAFTLGYSVTPGALPNAATKVRQLFDFYKVHEGSSIPFYFYDPAEWGSADYTPVNYREDPATRPSSPGTGNNPAPATGRFIMRFRDDNLNLEKFAVLLTKMELVIEGYTG